jgi:hypothetical protein
MSSTNEEPDRSTPPWLQLTLLVVLLVVLVACLGGHAPSGRYAGAVSALSSLGDGVVDLAGSMLGIRSCRVGRGTPHVSSNLRQIALGMICYSSESNGVWPRDFKLLQDWSDGELVPKLFRDPRWPADPDPFVYVRPSLAVTAEQPILLTRPTTGSKPMVVICYGDGHIGKVAGTALWDEARRLARLPKAMAEGIAPEDWTTVPVQRGIR